MAYVALYRTYRPKNFGEVIGQKHIIKTLKNAVAENKTSHAYIFSGLRGIGKTTIARILARAVNCENPIDGEPCNQCKNCLAILNDETTDIVELDAASNNGVDEMREILEKVNFLPSVLRKKVYIIDEAHMLSTAAFNALLKTLEEPPLHVMFILATTEPHKIPQTILSRCQSFDFKQLSVEEISKEINLICEKENIKIENDAVVAIAESAEGGMRDALSILDQASVYSNDTITVEDVDCVTGRISNYKLIDLVKNLKEKNAAEAIKIVGDLINSGKEVSRIVSGTIQFCRDVLLYKNDIDTKNSKNIYKSDSFKELVDELSESELFYYIDVLVDIQNKIRFTNSQKIYFEVGLLKIVNSAEEDIDILGRIHKLETTANEKNGLSTYVPNGEIENRLNNIDNKIRKVTSDLEKADLDNFKEKIESKMEMIEDVASKGATIDTDISQKFDSIEDKIRLLSIDTKGAHADEIKALSEKLLELENKITSQPINNETLNGEKTQENKAELEEIKKKIADLEDFVLSSGTSQKNENSDEEIKNRILEIEKRLNDVTVNNIKSNNTPSENILELSKYFELRLQSIEDFSEKLAHEISNLALKFKETYITNEEFNKEIAELKENYAVLVQTIHNVKEQNVASDSIQDVLVLKEKVELLVQQIENVKEKTFNFDSALAELKENKQSVAALESIQNKDLNELKNEFVVIKGQIEDLTTKMATKEVHKPEILPAKPTKEVVVDMPKEPIVTNPEPKIIETNETKTVKTVKNVYDIRIVERILQDSWGIECREEKIRLINSWKKLEDKVGYVLAPVAKILHDGKLAANGKTDLLIVYPSATICNHLMEPKNYNDAKQVIRITFGKDYEFLALPENTWQEKRAEYIGQHSIGIKQPRLTPINNPELNVVIPNYEDTEQKQKRPLQQAKAFFGGDVVEEEEE